MAGKKQKTSELQPLEKQLILDIVLGKKTQLRDKALLSVLYLTGARIREILPNKERKWRGFTIEQIKLNDAGTHVLFKNIPTLKRRKGKTIFRTVPVPYEKERLFLQIIDAYIHNLDKDIHSTVMFPMTRQNAWRIMKKFSKEWYCHLLRHMRSTDLVTNYGLNGSELRQWHAWTDSRPSDIYVHLGWQDIARKMK